MADIRAAVEKNQGIKEDCPKDILAENVKKIVGN